MVSFVQNTENAINSFDVTPGTLYYATDTGATYLDTEGGERIQLSTDIVPVNTEEDRINILAPLPDTFYVVLATSRVYMYHDGVWIGLTGDKNDRIYYNQVATVDEEAGTATITITDSGIATFIPDISVADIAGSPNISTANGRTNILFNVPYPIFGTVTIKDPV